MTSHAIRLVVSFAAVLHSTIALATAEEPGDPERETMERLRAIAGALQPRWMDEDHERTDWSTPARAALQPGDPPNLVRMPPAADRLSYQGVADLLQPRPDIIYLDEIPTEDAWGEKLEVYFDSEHVGAGRVITVRSSGANRRFDADAYESGAFDPGAAIDDIVIADQRFVRWPRGVSEVELAVKKRP